MITTLRKMPMTHILWPLLKCAANTLRIRKNKLITNHNNQLQKGNKMNQQKRNARRGKRHEDGLTAAQITEFKKQASSGMNEKALGALVGCAGITAHNMKVRLGITTNSNGRIYKTESRAGETTKPQPDPSTRKMRRCLMGEKCNNDLFASRGFGDRFCPACRTSTTVMSSDPQMMGA